MTVRFCESIMIALIIYMLFGLALAFAVLPAHRTAVKCWLGMVFGCVALMWFPCLPAFFIGFTLTAQYMALAAAAAGAVVLAVIAFRARTGFDFTRTDVIGLLMSLMAVLFCAYLLHTHVLCPHEDGSLWVGQSTYGDLAMHLGFAESLYQQGTFPPEYSIYPGQQLNYPFLVDAASASLRFFGMSLRAAFIAPSLVMLMCVFWGIWLLAQDITHKTGSSVLSWLLFVCNGGLGFFYFFGKYDFSEIFTGYYTTPTNLVDENMRWVNVICDMLIPQRTTMAGWCVGIAAIFLLITAIRKTLRRQGGLREFLVLAVVGGSLLMIHTHTFLALGILSAAWFFCALPAAVRGGQAGVLVRRYVLYGLICIGLAAPQFIHWTMDSVGSGNLLQGNLGWVSNDENWLWFFTKNDGIVFILMWVVVFYLRGSEMAEKRMLFIGATAIFVLANVMAFQPNLYDNNKLLYIWYIIVDIIVCDWIWTQLCRLRWPAVRAILTAIVVFLGTFSGILSMIREAVSEYQLLSAEQVQAAQFVEENTEPDSLILTSTAHTNAVAVLTGRNIPCGSSLYLYFHGVDYQQREVQVAQMYQGGEAFETGAAELGIDYVYIGSDEYSRYTVNYDYFLQNYPLIYCEDGISIFQITQ